MNKYNKKMMHERELIYDAKRAIHRTDVEKKDRASIAKHWYKNAQIYIMESNKQERKNLMDDMPIDNRATSPNKMRDYGKPTSPVAMRMAATKSGLPMKESPAMMYGGKKGDESKSRRDYESPMKMYGGKKGDMSKSKRDYESPMAMRETPLMKALVGNQDKLPEALQAEIKASPAKMYGGKKGDMSKSRRDYK